jgi:hypothetical protein
MVALSLGLSLAAPMPAAAQGELAGGLSFMNGDGGTGTGFVVDYSRPFAPAMPGWFGWVADLSMHDDDDVRVTTVMGGVRYSRRAGDRLTWFVQGLAGLGRISATGDVADQCDTFDVDCSDNDWAFAPGGGVNVPVGRRAALRGQIDFVTIAAEGASLDVRRFWFGVSLRLGSTP